MTGDRLKKLEAGFLEGSLSDAEENELKIWVQEHPEHVLSPYFKWANSPEEVEIPDFRSRVNLQTDKATFPWLKVAAAVIILAIAGFFLKDNLSDRKEKYSQAQIDESYEATMETLSAMAGFLDQGLSEAEQAIDLSKPFKKLNELSKPNIDTK